MSDEMLRIKETKDLKEDNESGKDSKNEINMMDSREPYGNELRSKETESDDTDEKMALPDGELMKNDKEIVIPGDEITKSMNYLPGKNCYRLGEFIISRMIGIVNINHRVISVIPIKSAYSPRPGDMVIGEVKEIESNRGWIININSPYEAFLPLSGVREFVDTTRTSLSKIYAIGDVIYAKISARNQGSVQISMQDKRARKFRGGRIVNINPAKVPRLIGKQGSMIMQIKERTECRISVGQNGIIWIDGDMADVAINAFSFIEQNSFISGLTDKVGQLLEKTVKKTAKPEVKTVPADKQEVKK